MRLTETYETKQLALHCASPKNLCLGNNLGKSEPTLYLEDEFEGWLDEEALYAAKDKVLYLYQVPTTIHSKQFRLDYSEIPGG